MPCSMHMHHVCIQEPCLTYDINAGQLLLFLAMQYVQAPAIVLCHTVYTCIMLCSGPILDIRHRYQPMAIFLARQYEHASFVFRSGNQCLTHDINARQWPLFFALQYTHASCYALDLHLRNYTIRPMLYAQ